MSHNKSEEQMSQISPSNLNQRLELTSQRQQNYAVLFWIRGHNSPPANGGAPLACGLARRNSPAVPAVGRPLRPGGEHRSRGGGSQGLPQGGTSIPEDGRLHQPRQGARGGSLHIFLFPDDREACQAQQQGIPGQQLPRRVYWGHTHLHSSHLSPSSPLWPLWR